MHGFTSKTFLMPESEGDHAHVSSTILVMLQYKLACKKLILTFSMLQTKELYAHSHRMMFASETLSGGYNFR